MDKIILGTFKQEASSNLLALEKHGETETSTGLFSSVTTKYHPDVIRERALIALNKEKYANGAAIKADRKAQLPQERN